MRKHLEQIPAVVVIFFDLDWDEVMWKERQMECTTRVEIVRNSLMGRGTRVCVVLIQKNAPLPPGEDVIAAERAASLCSACDLSAKSLFVLPLTDHLLGYTIRLENAFYELAQSYYHTEGRRVKSHKDFLNKTTHQLLFVRHQFKIAFFNELKQDPHTSLKHYKQAYTHILELRMLDTNLLEVKTIAGFINYKICRLSFQLNTPLDAIAHFRKHIDFFKSKIGIADVSFEHSAWMTKQFQVFGDLFDEAIKVGGLTAIQTQHPGFYYQQAAYHSMTRKALAAKIQPSTPAISEVLDNLNNLDYYGQRPWRQGHQSIEPPDLAKEKDGIISLQLLESKVDHSWIIIPLLGNAVTQFKKYKSPRMKRYLMVQMGEEYYSVSDFSKALALLSRVTWEYRQERWWSLLTSVLTTQLKCAYLVANVQEYVTVCLELLGKYTENSVDDKKRIHANLVRVMSNSVPEPEPGLVNETSVHNAKLLWNNLSAGAGIQLSTQQQHPAAFTIEMTNITPFVECKALFTKESFTADMPITVKLYARSSSPLPVEFSKLSLTFSNQAYNRDCVLRSETGGDTLCLKQNEIKEYTFSFVCLPEDVGKVLEITSVCLELGSVPGCCAMLHWTGAGCDAVTPLLSQAVGYYRSTRALQRQAKATGDVQAWEEIMVRPITRLLMRDSMAVEVDVKHSPPGLVNETYHYTVTVTNTEVSDITNVRVTLTFKDTHQSANTQIYLQSVEDRRQLDASKPWIMSIMKPEQQVTLNYYSKTTTTADLILVVTVLYDIQVEVQGNLVDCCCHKEQNVCLSIIEPLIINFQMLSNQLDKLDQVTIDEPFVLSTDIHSLTTWPLYIVTSCLQPSANISCGPVDGKIQSRLSDVTLKDPADHIGECFSLVATMATSPTSLTPQTPPASTVLLGQYVITLRRDALDATSFDVTVKLPSVSITSLPIRVTLSIPASVSVQASVRAVYSIHNRTDLLQDVEVIMESSDAFMFAGHRQVHFRVLPHDTYQLTYNMVPLVSGTVHLPKMHLNMPRFPDVMTAAVHRMLPSTIFVQPCYRNSTSLLPGL
jgi:hypothetical protein